MPTIVVSVLLVLFGLWWGVPHYLMWRADNMVRKLCAKDGGVRIFKKISVDEEEYRKIFNRKSEQYITFKEYSNPKSKYYIVDNSTYIKNGYLKIVKTEYDLIKRQNGLILAKSIFYSRRGGDPIGPWERTYFTCPKANEEFLYSIFVMEKKDNE